MPQPAIARLRKDDEFWGLRLQIIDNFVLVAGRQGSRNHERVAGDEAGGTEPLRVTKNFRLRTGHVNKIIRGTNLRDLRAHELSLDERQTQLWFFQVEWIHVK